MWELEKTILQKDKIFHYKILDAHRSCISTLQWVSLIINSSTFRSFYSDILFSSKFKGFFWEVKPVNVATLKNDFEFVIIDSSAVASLKKDDSSFKSYFKENEMVTSFLNIGKDANLVVPCPISEGTDYAHFASFLRTANQDQIESVWKKIASVYIDKTNEKPLWLSTSGLGVSWLHIRLDSTPKYYQYQPYRTFMEST